MIKQMWSASTFNDKVLFIIGVGFGLLNLLTQEYMIAILFFVIALDQVNIGALRVHIKALQEQLKRPLW